MPLPDPVLGPIATDVDRPLGGWLKSTRLGHGVSLRVVAERLDVSPQAVHQFEKSEVAGTISLRQLEHVARAMGCRVVYALRPQETREQARAAPARVAHTVPQSTAFAAADVRRKIEHSMFLENRAADRFD
jgi:transcriptional regulator with XRE-family HTH domain